MWMLVMTWIRVTTHWVISDCGLRKGHRLHTKKKLGCVGFTYARGWMRLCVEFRDKILFKGGRM